MLDRLVASAPVKSWSLGGAMFSVAFHGALLYAVVHATMGRGGSTGQAAMDTTLVFVQPEEQQEPEVLPVPQLPDMASGFVTLVAPASIPTDLPPINTKEVFDPRDFTGVGLERLPSEVRRGGSEVGPGAAYAEAMVDEKPEIISSPPLHYPEILRQAGVEGAVMVEAIIDTLGRAEPGSVRVIQSASPGFDAPARDVILKALYRPGRVAGQVVRVLVNVPVNFSIRKRAE